MSHPRQDPLRGWWTLVSPRRGARPVDAALGAPAGQEPVPGCPFCPGGEDQLGPVVEEVSAAGGAGWAARAVLNLFPFVKGDQGRQEVLVETPRHLPAFHLLSPEEARTAVYLYRARLRALHRDHPGWEAHLFRNQGRDAGTSRTHPHAQLVGLPGPSPGRRELEARLRAAHAEEGGCRVCSLASGDGGEPDEDRRTVARTAHFRAATLHAPLDPYHLRILPLRHGPSLAGAPDAEVEELAVLLLRLTRALESALPGVAWNLLVHDHGITPDAALHWHLELRPRVGRTAGFELMSQIGVAPSDPVEDAARLRALLDQDIPP